MPEPKRHLDKIEKPSGPARMISLDVPNNRPGEGEASSSVLGFCEQIRKDAEEEVKAILGRAEASARRKIEEAEKEATGTARQITGAADAEAKKIESRTMSGASLETRKTMLKTQGEIIEEVLAGVGTRLRELRETGEYLDFLKKLSVQGISAIGEEECVLVPGAEDKELFTAELIAEIGKLVVETSGRKITVSLSHDLAPEGHGVRVYSGSRRMLFDNTLEARMERLTDELRNLVAREAFARSKATKETEDTKTIPERQGEKDSA